MTNLAILGSTGSIGQNTLRVVESFGERFRVLGLTAGDNLELLARQVIRFRPAVVSIREETNRQALRRRLTESGLSERDQPEVLAGCPGMVAVASQPDLDIVVSATVGVAGLPATLEAVRLGKRIALANKEVMVAAGELITAEAGVSGAEILPVDSEHNALHQCLRGGRRDEVRRLILTASGGPFLHTSPEELERVTPEQALRHPTWQMGNRITIDSATLMNKGFEIIEARWLFGFCPEQVDVYIHPQSTVHSLVEFVDGSLLAQLSVTDMRLPIQYALTYPERAEAPTLPDGAPGPDSPGLRIGLEAMRQLEFWAPDRRRFPCLDLAYRALAAGGAAGCALNAADEVAVEQFLAGRIGFTGIPRVIEQVLEKTGSRPARNLDEILECDREARIAARGAVERSLN